MGLELGDHRFQALLEIAAVARPGEQGAHVEGEYGRLEQDFGDLPLDDPPREPFGEGGLADPRIADIERVVLGAPAEHLDRAFDLGVAADQRIDLARRRLRVEVDAIGRERFVGGLARPVASVVGPAVRALHDPVAVRPSGHLGDAVGDVVDRVEARHVLFLQVEDGVRFALGEHRHQHVGAGDLLAARGLHVDRRALDHPLEARRRLRVLVFADFEVGELFVEIDFELGAQPLHVDAAGAQHGERVLVLGQRHQQMFEGGVFVVAVVGERQRPVQASLEVPRQHPFRPFRACIAAGAGSCGRGPSPWSPWSPRPRR